MHKSGRQSVPSRGSQSLSESWRNADNSGLLLNDLVPTFEVEALAKMSTSFGTIADTFAT